MSFEHSPYQYQMHSNRNATKGMHLNTIPGILDILNAFHHLINSIICLSFFFFTYMYLPLFAAVCFAPVFAYVRLRVV